MLDESISVFVLLRSLPQDKGVFEAYIKRLSLQLEAKAFGFPQRDTSSQDVSGDNSPARNDDILWSGNIDTSRQYIVTVQESAGEQYSKHVLAIWKISVPLSGSSIHSPECAAND